MESVSGVGVLDKAIAVLQAIWQRGPLALADLQAAVGMPRATTHRLAVALEQHGLLRRNPDGRFNLGLALVGLGGAARERLPVALAARPVMEELRDRTGESVQLFVLEGSGRRCVVSLESTHGLRWIVPEGALLPLDRGSAGRVLSAAVAEQRRSKRAASNANDSATRWVESVEEREKGVASVSAPVLDGSGNVVAALSVSGPVERLTRSPGVRFGTTVVDAAAAITRRLAS